MIRNRLNIEQPASPGIKTLATLVCALALFTTACQNQLLEQAAFFERSGQPGKSESVLLRHLEAHPDDARARFWLAELQGRQKKFDEMAASLALVEQQDRRWREAAADLREKYWRENYNEGVRALAVMQIPEAVAALRQAVVILPERHAAYPLLGAALLANRQREEACAAFEQACRLNPEDLDSRHALLRLYFDSGRYAETLARSGEILRRFRDDVSALRATAHALERMAAAANSDSLNFAAEAALKRLLLLTMSAEDFIALGGHYYRRGDHRNAALQFEEAARLQPDNTEVLRYLGDCAWQLGDFTAMAKWYTRLLLNRPADVEAVKNLLIAEQALGRNAEAERLKARLQQLQGSME
ncbi:MAG: tetratricopeptide repeat protein [candidate division KSB1 bacterium]|nr:tetratricopeptide repeat protein [candidate division KSB1 bacterium]MDZ7273120.1 tetratricopeptide repeat protein [candidate division KSB1 bacterium]MDZ7285222.1 tetratricopeptide repeat protein [candidate division KSB1 bacterium]MDZ7298254.1 tetratricopeptide repeat protein [candidate division KSB1 bacterium]MDZ7308271.1 tetratricopeptide repeat protein [candidate division KSB1 bacterium]